MRPTAVRFDLGANFICQVVTRTIIKGHVCAFAREHFTKRGADAPRASGDKRPLTFE
jgi:hypothetical protein